jgi:hypothetical protein
MKAQVRRPLQRRTFGINLGKKIGLDLGFTKLGASYGEHVNVGHQADASKHDMSGNPTLVNKNLINIVNSNPIVENQPVPEVPEEPVVAELPAPSASEVFPISPQATPFSVLQPNIFQLQRWITNSSSSVDEQSQNSFFQNIGLNQVNETLISRLPPIDPRINRRAFNVGLNKNKDQASRRKIKTGCPTAKIVPLKLVNPRFNKMPGSGKTPRGNTDLKRDRSQIEDVLNTGSPTIVKRPFLKPETKLINCKPISSGGNDNDLNLMLIKKLDLILETANQCSSFCNNEVRDLLTELKQMVEKL